MPLEEYRNKRDFEVTPEPPDEPAPEISEHERAGRPRFTIQEHHATALHWDVRLEHNGVLVSFACPKGLPPDPRVNNLAVHTEDHPMMYLTFHGTIPAGEYGGGRMTVWDTGWYEVEKFDEEREVMVTFHGERARGRYVFFRTEGKNWMVHRMDPPEDPTRELLPIHLAPMIPVDAGALPDDEDQWAFEVDWGGHRLLVGVEGGRAVTGPSPSPNAESAGVDQWPEVKEMARELGSLQVVLDGQLVVLDPDTGRPDHSRLLRRANTSSDSSVKRMARSSPAVYLISDLLFLDGHRTTPLAWEQRRSLLDRLELDGPTWRVPTSHPGEGTALLQAARAQDLPGIIAKRLDSPYLSGETSEHWIRIAA